MTVGPVSLSVSEGGVGVWWVVLKSEPAAPVRVTATVTGDDDLAIKGGSILVFTTANWGTLLPLTVGASEDADDFNGTATITHSATSDDDAYDGIGIASIDLAEVDDDLPPAPMELAGEPDDEAVVLGWTAPEVHGITSWEVRHRESDGGTWSTWDSLEWKPLAPTPAEHRVEELDNGTSYDFEVVAVNANGRSAAAGTTVVPALPNAPPVFTSMGALQVEETQTAVGTLEATDADEVDEVAYAISGGADGALFSLDATTGALAFKAAPDYEGPVDQASADPENRAQNNEYIVEVEAASGAESRRRTASLTVTVTVTDKDGEVPGVPGDFEVTASTATTVTLAWTAPVENPGPVLSGYDIEVRTQGTGGWSAWADADYDGTAQGAKVGGLADGASHELRLRARNEEGAGPWTAALSHETKALTLVFLPDPSSPLAVPEGGSASYAARLDDPPTGDVTVALSVEGDADLTVAPAHLTYLAADWNRLQTVTVSAAADTDGAAGVAAVVHEATGGGYDGVTMERAVVEGDDDAEILLSISGQEVTVLSISGQEVTVPEGESVTFTAVLAAAPGGPVTVTAAVAEMPAPDGDLTVTPQALTFTTAAWRIPQTVTVAAAEDDDGIVGTAILDLEPDDGFPAEAPRLVLTEGENDAVLILSETEVTVPEGGTFAWTVVLGALPEDTVTVTVARSEGDTNFKVAKSLTFTTDDWATPQTVTVRATHDKDDKDGTATILHAATGPAGYDGATAEVKATEEDDDGVTVSVETIGVPEGGHASYTVVLDSKPTATVTITATPGAGDTDLTVTTSDPALTVATDTLTFTTDNWSTPQTVNVKAAPDTDNANGTRTIGHVATGGYQNMTIADVVATEIDDDQGTVTVSVSELDVREGESATYTLVLDRAPSAAVVISITTPFTTDGDLTPSPGALTFTADDWRTPQIVTVSAAEDADNDAGSTTIVHGVASDDVGYHGITVAHVTATEVDNDGVTVSATTIDVPDGGDASYTVVLDVLPTSPVTVAVAAESDGDPDLTASPASLTFATGDWSTPQTVTVSAAADSDRVAGSATFAHTATSKDTDYQGFEGPKVVATEVEKDAGLKVPVAAVTVPEDGQADWTVALNTEPAAPVTVTVTLDSAANADLKASPASLTFTTDDWRAPQTVTVSAALDLDNKDGSAEFVLTATSADTGYQGVDARVTATEKDGAPPSPTGFAGVVGDGTVTLTWDDPEDPAITGYRIRQRPGPLANPVNTWVEVEFEGTGTRHVVTGLENGTVHDFRIHARSEAGQSSFAVAAKLTPQAGPPPRPTGFEASPGNAQVALGWTDPGDPDIVRWQVRWRLADGAWPSDSDGDVWTNIDGSGADTVAHSVTDLENARAYDFQVRALAGPTLLVGPASEVVRATPLDVGAGVTVEAAQDPLEVPEGKQESWTVVLDALPSAPVTVAIVKADGDEDLTLVTTALTFTTDNWSTPQSVTVAAAEDVDVAPGNATFRHSALGGGYSGVAIADMATVEKDNDEASATLTPPELDVPEGGSATYTLVLDALPAAEVTITLDKADEGDRDLTAAPHVLTFTTANWNMAQTVTVTAAEDDGDSTNGEAVFAHLPSSTDAAFNFDTMTGGLIIDKITATELDNDMPGVTLSATELAVPEGGAARYTLTLGTRPSGDVTVAVAKDDGGDADLRAAPAALTFTTGTWNVPQTVEVEADADGDTEDGSAVFSHAVTGGGYDDVEIEDVTATEADDDSGVVVSATAVKAEENGSGGSWTLVLDALPSAEVTIAIRRADDGDPDLTATPAALTFTTGDWNVPRTVTVRAATDDDALDGEAVFSHQATSADNGFNGVRVAEVLVTETDSDDPGITVSPDEVSVFEGRTSTWTVVLDTRPGAPVTVRVSRRPGSAGNLTTSPGSLVFTTDDWATPWTVTVTAREAADMVDGEAVFSYSAKSADAGYAGVAGADVTVTEIDNDRAGVLLSRTGVTVPEGGENTWTAVLNRRPSGDVTLEVSWKSGDTDLTVATPRLTFTTADWDTPQTIRIRAEDDADGDHGSAVIGHATRGGGYTGAVIADVTATEEDEDVGLTLSAGTLRIAEEGSAEYTVALAAEPGASVTVSVEKEQGGDEDLTVQPSELVFTTSNWNTGQTVTVGADADTDVVEGMARILHRAGDLRASVAVFEIDDDAAVDLVVEAEPLEVPEGGSDDYTIRLEAPPSGAVTIRLRARGDPDLSVSPAALTFTTGNWGDAQTVTVSAAEDRDVVAGQALVSHGIAGGDYDRVAIPGVTVIEVENDMLGVTLSRSAIGVPEGGSDAYTVVLDAQPSGAVTIDLTASGDGDLRASPAALTFTTGNWSEAQTVTVVADPDADAAHGEATIAHAIAGGGYGGVAVPAVTLTEKDDDGTLLLSATRVVVPEDDEAQWTVHLAGRPAEPVTVSLSTAGDADLTVSPETLTFTTASWNTPQTVTAAAADDPDAANGETVVTLSAAGGAFSGVSATLTAVEEDDDAELVLSRTAVTVPEGGSRNWTVALGAAPGGPVTVATRVVGDDSASFAVSPDALTFTAANWQRPQSVTVAGVEDGDVRDNEVEVRHQANGGGYVVVTGSVTVTQTDNDSNIILQHRPRTSVTYVPLPSRLLVPEGTAGDKPSVSGERVLVSLAEPPDDGTIEVTVNVRRVQGDTDLRSTDLANPLSTVTLEKGGGWDQEIIIHAQNDDDVLWGEATFEFSMTGGAVNRLVAVEQDDDAKITVVAPNPLEITEGGGGTYTVALGAAPAEEVEVAVSWNEDKAVTANPAVLTFTTSNWSTAQTVTVSATPDADGDGFKATIKHRATGSDYAFGPCRRGAHRQQEASTKCWERATGGDHAFAHGANVKVEVTDTDTAGLKVGPTSLVVTEGSSAIYTVALATEPGGPVTIGVAPKAGSDPRLGASPTSLVFTSGNWSVPQTVTVTADPDPRAIEATATFVHTLANPGSYDIGAPPDGDGDGGRHGREARGDGPRDHRRRGVRRLHGGPQRRSRPVGHGRGACRARRRCDGGADRTDLHDRQLVDGADRDRHHRVGRRHARRRAGCPFRGLRRSLRRRPRQGIRG